MSSTRRILIGLSLIWMIIAIGFAQSSANIWPHDCINSICICNNQNIEILANWLKYSLPSIIMISFVWASYIKDNKTTYLTNNKHIRFSIAWLVVPLSFMIFVIIDSYTSFYCGDSSNYLIKDHFLSCIELFFMPLQIPLFLYWVIRWMIKGNNVLN